MAAQRPGTNDRRAENESTMPPSEFAVQDPEQFAMNMARMLEHIGKAASAWVEPREKGETIETGPVSMTEVVETLSKVGEYWMTDPMRAIEAQTSLFAGYMTVWNNSIRRLAGEDLNGSAITPPKGDKRFSDEDWQKNFFFDFLKQAYIMTTRWADDLVERADGLDEHTKHKAAFYMRQVSNALSPTNFVATNPELYRETIASNGENLVKGMKMFAEDMAAGRGNLRLRQADYNAFEVGRDMAVTPGKVIAQNEICQIIQYAPRTETVWKKPILISPPWINKFSTSIRRNPSSAGWSIRVTRSSSSPGSIPMRAMRKRPGRTISRTASSMASTRSNRRSASDR